MKMCSKCRDNKDASEFNKDRRSPSGLRSFCKACASAWQKQYRSRQSPEKRAESLRCLKEWQHNNPDRVAKHRKKHNKIGCHKRRARKLNLPATLTNAQWQETLELCNHKCVYCGAPWEHQDHFIPLSKGGGYIVNNILPACGSCNSKKGTLDPFNFIDRQQMGQTLNWISKQVG